MLNAIKQTTAKLSEVVCGGLEVGVKGEEGGN